jgi:hypothetical protein
VTPSFRSTLVFEDDGGLPFRLMQPLVFDSAVLRRTVTVPTGFMTDLASIPRGLWNILPPVGVYDAAAVIHDLLYQCGAVDGCAIERGDADRVLREAMEATGVNRWQRWTIYAGVRAGGWIVWTRYRSASKSGLEPCS